MAFNTMVYNRFHWESLDKDSRSKEEDSPVPSVLDVELTSLTFGQRITFTVFVGVLCVLSVFGNLGALYANRNRKVRLFFRTCLISLALSDLITTVFMSAGYLVQFGAPYVQIWCLGGLMCRFIPFVTTGAILVSSMTLVGIALDRYFAVMRSVLAFWKPNKMFCVLYALGTWGLAYGIASPMYAAYTIFQVYILTEGVDRDGSTELVDIELVKMCVSEKESNAYYYIVVLAIIFVPTLVAFVWLNSIIANKLWIRRHSVGAGPSTPPTRAAPTTPVSALSATAAVGSGRHEEKQMEMVQQQYDHPCHCHCQGDNKICTSSTLTVPTSLAATTTTTTTIAATTGTKSLENNLKTNAIGTGCGGSSAKHISSREARHLRMFTIVLILMAVFIFFRLPAWIFLILRMYGTYTRPVHWILHFSFGVLTLASCVLNPLLYTFLAETIQYAMLMKGKLCGLRRYFANCRVGAERLWHSICNDDNVHEKMSQNQQQDQNQNRNSNQNTNQNDQDHNDDDDDDDGKSNDGAKSTSRKSDDDSKVCTIIPVLRDIIY